MTKTHTVEVLLDGIPLLVMEYVEGGSLADLLDKYPDGFLVEQTLDIACQVLRVLAAFHRLPAAPVYRDDRPENPLLDSRGVPRRLLKKPPRLEM